uniref:Uncharacterized protein n=1 Tax=Trypanosoma congolense (strain IL3000) TaxID=1068625 RepID=G0ULA5_TRYCI|nr:conserved hypothetical protein [Trypanosoma congolense IL3000]
MRGVVYYGEQFVEVPDASVTLKDICASFGIEGDLTGVCIKSRATGLIVVTLPFESLPEPCSDSGDMEDITYDLTTPDGGNDDDDDAGGKVSSTDDMTDILKQLVQLGAAPLLSAESNATIDPYDPRAAPGLLTRMIYPPSIYSPYRYCGDPLSSADRLGPSPATLLQQATPPYVSSVETYTVEKADESSLRQRPDLTPKTDEETNDIMQGLLTVASQARAIAALSNENRQVEVDVKPNIQSIALAD